ncbi:MAG: single-stranded DNA-binding protein [Calditrichaceae bacterium]|nr:single-stranded DNA-binding protein [Calditrichaceae bacterium]MBN2707723.1 single-stranded DNA-binding protein [Calditrichaceae bacterium]RQV96461.1 MAG: single-stranded DNA-binding protein [Calditrichota bacterium]
MSKGTINKAIIIGRLGQDPDMRYAPSGTAIASFSAATNHRMRDSEGNWNEQTEWHNIKAFGKLAEFVGEYLKKGKTIFIEGRLQTSNWEDKNGQRHYKTEIIANEIQLIGSRDGGSPATKESEPEEAAAPVPDAPADNPEEDDLPF